MPDKYLRKDEIPAQESGPTTTGFNGDDLIQVPEAPIPVASSRAGGLPPTPAQVASGRQARVEGVKQEFARLTLGMFVASFSAYPLAFTYAGEAESPQGKADAIDVKGPTDLMMRLFIHRETHLPLMISWRTPPGRGQAAPTEHRVYYADYRDVSGVRFPFRIRLAVGPDTVEETTIDRYRVNVNVDPKKFEVRK